MLKPERLYFIDALRAFAIIMMMQGHFVDTLLDPIYEDSGNIYSVWAFFRGITAPTFFTISGFVYIYLLLKNPDVALQKLRIKKGIKRGLLLVLIGYTLRIPLMSWLSGTFNDYFLIVDVLQCIGLGLLLLIALYYLSLKSKWLLLVLSLVSGLAIFILEPLYRGATFDFLPLVISNYLTRANGSVFTIIPWFGFISFGAALAILFNLFQDFKVFKTVFIIGLITAGVFLSTYSSSFFISIYHKTDFIILKKVAYYNYLFERLGHVLILFSIFYSLNNAFKAQWILKIGQKTLSIYVVHFIILYGSFTGLGLHQLTGATLSPWGSAIGAVLFVIGVCVLSAIDFYSNNFFYNEWKKLLDILKNKRDK